MVRSIAMCLAIFIVQPAWEIGHGIVAADRGLDEASPTSQENERSMTTQFRHVVGFVTASDGEPIVGASVLPHSLDRPSKPIDQIGIITDPQGHYRWLLLPGRYSITVWKAGFQRATKSTVVEVAGDARLDFVLEAVNQ